MGGTLRSGSPSEATNANNRNRWTRSSTPGITCVTNWQAASASGMSLSCISTRIIIRTSKAASISSLNERKNLVSALKNSPKIKQLVIVLFLSAALTAQHRDLLRLEITADAMGCSFKIEMYGSDRMPHRAKVAAAMTKVEFQHIRLNPQARTVWFDHTGVEIDPGGIGKGYAVDRMVDVLRQKGFGTALVAGSGSSIYGMGAPPDEPRGWRIEIKNPWDSSKTSAEVFLKDMSLSTSGSYEKFFRAGGRIYAHIMDPRTGYPAQGAVAVSVVAPRTIDSEAWAKPYFVNGRQWAARHRPKDFRVYFCEDRAEKTDRMEKACAWLQ